MYINENRGQMTLNGFYAPFTDWLLPENRWVKLTIALGRKNEAQKETEKQQIYRVIPASGIGSEESHGLLKTRYDMSRVMCKLDCCVKTDLVLPILAMNAFPK